MNNLYSQTAQVWQYTTTNDSKVAVQYKIQGGHKSEAYKIEVQFYDKTGKLPAFALTGDYPEIMWGEDTYTLIWDVLKDRQELPRLTKVVIKVTDYRIVTTSKGEVLPNPVKMNNSRNDNKANYDNDDNNVNNRVPDSPSETSSYGKKHQQLPKQPRQPKAFRQPFTLGIAGGLGLGMTMGTLSFPEKNTFENPVFLGYGIGLTMPVTILCFDVSTNGYEAIKEDDEEFLLSYRNWNYGLTINTDWLSATRDKTILYFGGGYSSSKMALEIKDQEYKDRYQTYFGRAGLIFMLDKKKYVEIEYKHYFEDPPLGSLFFKFGAVI